MFKVKDETKTYIMTQLIEPEYTTNIKSMLREKKCWRLMGITFETISKLLIAAGSVLSFSVGYYTEYTNLSFIAGSISTISLACLQFSSFSYFQNAKQVKELNILLKSLNLDPIPVIVLSNDDEKQSAHEDSSSSTKSNDSEDTTRENTTNNGSSSILEDTKKDDTKKDDTKKDDIKKY